MSTARIYYDDAFAREFSAQVLRCEPFAPGAESSSPGEKWSVKLDRTAFYPTSGGQPHDVGALGDANVVDVLDEEEEIIHVVDRAVASGAIEGSIEWARRFDHMQQHTGQHVLSAVFHPSLRSRRCLFIWVRTFARLICAGENPRRKHWRAQRAPLMKLSTKTAQ